MVCWDHLLGAQDHGVVLIIGSTLDVPEQLVVPLYLVNHLTVDVFNVKVLPGYKKCAASPASI